MVVAVAVVGSIESVGSKELHLHPIPTRSKDG